MINHHLPRVLIALNLASLKDLFVRAIVLPPAQNCLYFCASLQAFELKMPGNNFYKNQRPIKGTSAKIWPVPHCMAKV